MKVTVHAYCLINCMFRVPLCAKKYYNIVVNVFKDWRDEGGRLSGRHRGFRRQVVQPCRGSHSLKGTVNRDCKLQESAYLASVSNP
jgi:hypothetical protein